MPEDIKKIVDTISQAGGEMTSRDLVEKFGSDRKKRREVQQTVQKALDKGYVSLSPDLKLNVKKAANAA